MKTNMNQSNSLKQRAFARVYHYLIACGNSHEEATDKAISFIENASHLYLVSFTI